MIGGVRPATEADSDAIGRVHVAAWRETYRGQVPDRILDALSAEQRAAQWRAGLARGAQGPLVFVAEEPGKGVVGFGAAGKARGAALGCDGEIYALYILREAQGLGYGRALLRHLAEALAARQLGSMGLWVLTANARASAFYRRFSGAISGQRSEDLDGWACHESAFVWRDLGAAIDRLQANTSNTLAPIEKAIVVRCHPPRAFAVFAEQMGDWWPKEHHSVSAEDCADCGIEPRLGGTVYEVTKAGTRHLWGSVTAWDRPNHLAFTWHPGRTADDDNHIAIRFLPDSLGTRVMLTHSGWSDAAKRAAYFEGWDFVLERYRACADA